MPLTAGVITHRKSDTTHPLAGREATLRIRQQLPAAPLIGTVVDARAAAAFGEVPGLAFPLPGGGKEFVRPFRVPYQVHYPRTIVDAQGLRPVGAAIGGEEYAAFGIRTVEVTQRSYPHLVDVVLVDQDPPDVVGFGQAQGGPIFAVVVTAVHPVTGVATAAAVDLTGAHVDGSASPVHVQVTDRHHGLVVKQGGEAASVVDGLPESATCVAYVEVGRITGIYRHVRHPTTHDAGADIREGQST